MYARTLVKLSNEPLIYLRLPQVRRPSGGRFPVGQFLFVSEVFPASVLIRHGAVFGTPGVVKPSVMWRGGLTAELVFRAKSHKNSN